MPGESLHALSSSWAAGPSEPVAEPVNDIAALPTSPAAEPVAPAEPAAPVEGQPRDDKGRFAPVAGDPAAPPEPAAEPVAAAPAAPAPEVIEGKRGDEVVPLPKDVLVPLKRNGTVEYKPLDEVLRGGMLKADYDAKMREIAEQRRATVRTEAAFRAREAALKAQEEQLRGALTDPRAFEQYQEHLRQYAENPVYRQAWDRAQEADGLKADMAARQAEEQDAILHDAISQATAWIEEAVARTPGVSMERVRALYGQALHAGTARFDPADVERIVATEAQAIAAYTSPLTQRMQALEAELAKYRADAEAAKRNATTEHALKRAATITTAPAGSPAAPVARDFGGRPGAQSFSRLSEDWKRG